MASDELPTLDHGIPSPETYVPGVPDWFWWVLGVGGVLVLALLIWAVKLLRPTPAPPTPSPRDSYTPSLEALSQLEEDCASELISVIAARSSLIIRSYLADSRSEPALYETAEEFAARQGKLPASANAFLNELNEAKYDQSSIDEDRSREIISQSRECLKKLHAFSPKDTPPPVPTVPEKDQIVRNRIIVLFPLGVATALSAFLIQLYDGRDTGTRIEVSYLVWVMLGVAMASLVFHLINRQQT